MMSPLIPSVAAAHHHHLLPHTSRSASLKSAVTLFTGTEMDKTYLRLRCWHLTALNNKPAISHSCLGFQNDCGTLIMPELRWSKTRILIFIMYTAMWASKPTTYSEYDQNLTTTLATKSHWYYKDTEDFAQPQTRTSCFILQTNPLVTTSLTTRETCSLSERTTHDKSSC